MSRNQRSHEQKGSANAEETSEELVVWMPRVAAWGHHMIHASFDAWWEKNRRKARAQDPVAAEMAEIGRRVGDAAVEMSDALRRWLQGVAGPSELNPEAARKWLGVWNQLEAVRRAGTMPARHAGPSVERPGLTRQHAVGRAVHRRRGRTEQAERPDGTIITDPYDIARARMSTRDHIWFQPAPTKRGSEERHRGGVCGRAPA
jgi:hypothetical protein